MEATLAVETRSERGKNEARRLRQAGRVPAVVYGGETKGGTAVTVDPKALLRILHSDSGLNTLIALTLDAGKASQVLVKAFQLDPVSQELLHVDFYRLAMDKAITVTVPVTLKGEPVGVKQQGGVVDFVNRDVQVECMPTEIPDHLEVDITDLMIGDGVRLRDLLTDVAWTPMSDPDMLLVHVVAPRVEEEETPEEEVAEGAEAAAPEGGEPEVIKKGKAEDGERAGDDKGKGH